GRPLYRLALDCAAPREARARVRPGGSESTVTMCAGHPAALFSDSVERAVLTPNFDEEPYFGGGWRQVEHTRTGRVRRGTNGATLLLPLIANYNYGLSIDLVAAGRDGVVEIVLNGKNVGMCGLRDTACEVILPSGAVRDGVNALAL